jgi:hypothetical protein
MRCAKTGQVRSDSPARAPLTSPRFLSAIGAAATLARHEGLVTIAPRAHVRRFVAFDWKGSRAWIHREEAYFSVSMTLPVEPLHMVQKTAEAPSAIP